MIWAEVTSLFWMAWTTLEVSAFSYEPPGLIPYMTRSTSAPKARIQSNGPRK